MDVLAGGFGLLTLVYIIFGLLLLIAPLMIWSKASQILSEIRQTNIYLRHITIATEETAKQVATLRATQDRHNDRKGGKE